MNWIFVVAAAYDRVGSGNRIEDDTYEYGLGYLLRYGLGYRLGYVLGYRLGYSLGYVLGYGLL